jgi:DNA-binding NarL/FixJ family response regulator
MDKIRVLIADDHTLVRQGLSALFTAVPDIEVVAEAADGAEAIARAEDASPDVILMDLQMPGIHGIEATRRILEKHPGLGIIVVTMLDDDGSVFAAMRAGARGYILKGADKADVLKTIRAVAAGEALFGPGIAGRFMNFFHDLGAPSGQPPLPFPELTERERAILGLIAAGQGNAAIAEQLAISPKTVSNHISSIFNKLQVADRAQAAIRAREAGLGPDRRS